MLCYLSAEQKTFYERVMLGRFQCPAGHWFLFYVVALNAELRKAAEIGEFQCPEGGFDESND